MSQIHWDSQASLMRAMPIETSGDVMEELIQRGTVRELVGVVLARGGEEQRSLLIRAAGADWVEEYDAAAIRELAARPEYTGAYGDFDTAARGEDPDRDPAAAEETLIGAGLSGPSPTDAAGRDGER